VTRYHSRVSADDADDLDAAFFANALHCPDMGIHAGSVASTGE
jgi:hypothetical protein